MAIIGVDISRYQPPEAMDGYDFVICNVEDPGLVTKIDRAKNLGIPWGFYTWLYPGAGHHSMTRAQYQGTVHGDPPMGYWIDYEQSGVTPTDLGDALDTAATSGILDRTGVYTYLYMLPSVEAFLRSRPLWLAYYPGSNDGTYLAAQDDDARAHGAVLWQFSSGGNLDRNVVIDEVWYQAWTEGSDMGLSTSDIELLNLHHAEAGQWEWDTRNYVKDALFVSSIAIITKVLEGIPEVAIDEDAIKAAVEAAMADLPERTADELAERLRD